MGKSRDVPCPFRQKVATNLFILIDLFLFWTTPLKIPVESSRGVFVFSCHLVTVCQRPSLVPGSVVNPGHFPGYHEFPGKNMFALSGPFFEGRDLQS